MDDLPHLDYLDGRPSPPGLLGWKIFTACITWMDNLSLPALPTWMENFHCLIYFYCPNDLERQL
eukprot:3487887-Karenia_brevis.AAC.1